MPSTTKCFVQDCGYIAETVIDGPSGFQTFRVCPLHDHPNVKRILEEGFRPRALFTRGIPLVQPGDALGEITPQPGGRPALECANLAESPEDDRIVFERYRLS